jgi:hypothetical protein
LSAAFTVAFDAVFEAFDAAFFGATARTLLTGATHALGPHPARFIVPVEVLGVFFAAML